MAEWVLRMDGRMVLIAAALFILLGRGADGIAFVTVAILTALLYKGTLKRAIKWAAREKCRKV